MEQNIIKRATFVKNWYSMAATTEVQTLKLTPAQLHLLHLFSKKMSEKELKELKMLLVEWYDSKAQEEADRLWEERGMGAQTMETILETRFRSSAK